MEEAIAAAEAGDYCSAVALFEALISEPTCPHHQHQIPTSTLPANQHHAAHEMLAQCLMELEDLSHALHHARAAIALAPTYPPGLLTLGRAAAACGHFPEALDAFQTCVVPSAVATNVSTPTFSIWCTVNHTPRHAHSRCRPRGPCRS